MATLDLKSNLIDKISKIEDPEFFEALNVFMEFKLESKVYRTSNHQKLMVEEGLNQLENGEGISDDDVNRRMKEWLNEE